MAKKKAPLEDIQALPSTMDIKKSVDGYKAKIKALETLVESQQEMIASLNKKKFDLPIQRKPRHSKAGFLRVYLSDTHGSQTDWAAVNAVLADIEQMQPRQVVLGGDHLDCGGWLSAHGVFYVAETNHTYEDDVVQGNVLLDEIQRRVPKAEIFYISGNHERRVEAWCVNQTLRTGRDAQFLLDRIGPEAVLNLKKRGIPYYSQGEHYMGLPVRGTIKLGRVLFTHGSRHGKRAADSMLAAFQCPVVFGHVHKLLAASSSSVHGGMTAAWSSGSLCYPSPRWHHSDPSDWGQGVIWQIVRPDEQFLTVPTPIINSQSMLAGLIDAIKRVD